MLKHEGGGNTRLYDTTIEVINEQNERCARSELPRALRELDGKWKQIVVFTDGNERQLHVLAIQTHFL